MIATRRLASVALTAVAVAFVELITIEESGAFAVAEKQDHLTWEWRAGRALAQRAALKVESIKKESRGPFGVFTSPSLARSLPDAMVVVGNVLAVDRAGLAVPGRRITFRIPNMELKTTDKGDTIVIGVIGQAAVCLAPAPPGALEGDNTSWLQKIDC